jgi:hypothetical protein
MNESEKCVRQVLDTVFHQYVGGVVCLFRV